MNVSYLIITHNRCAGLLANLHSLFEVQPEADVWLVDNASTDDTVDAVRSEFPRVRLIALDKNQGMPARNVALRQMRSEFIVLLDDDSYPLPGAVEASVDHMRWNPGVAAVVGRAILPDGSFEAPALPSVLLGCATTVRLRALRDVGFFPHDFFRQAEEYDLSLRLWDAGYRVERFEDIAFRHDKRPSQSRASADVTALDLKHNLIVANRYLPTPFDEEYAADLAQRYAAIMSHAGHGGAVGRVLDDAERYIADADRLRRRRLTDNAFEAVFQHGSQSAAVTRWARENGLERVAIADVSKNLFATYTACRKAGLEIEAIVDDRPAFAGMTYRKLPVVSASQLNRAAIDGVVISNVNPAQIDRVSRTVGEQIDRPMLRLWNGKRCTSEIETLEFRDAA